MIEKDKLSIKFFKSLYGNKKLQVNVSKEIRKAQCPIDIGEMDIEDGLSILMIGDSLTFFDENTIQELLPEITAIIERCYLHEIANKK
jgi:hypothetical protein